MRVLLFRFRFFNSRKRLSKRPFVQRFFMRFIHRTLLRSLALAPLALTVPAQAQIEGFRPPSVPLVAHDPLFSIWSNSDKAYSSDTRHWTQREHALTTLIRVDDEALRVMGRGLEEMGALRQTGLKVTPTRSIYSFQNPKIALTLTFTSPLLPDDMDVLTRPVTYISYSVRSLDGKPHAVKIMQTMSGALAVNVPETPVKTDKTMVGNISALSVGAAEPTLLRPAGDDIRINWGRAFLAAPNAEASDIVGGDSLLRAFSDMGTFPMRSVLNGATYRAGDSSVALVLDAGQVGATPVERHSMVAYDEEYAVRFFSQNLRPYWRRNGGTPQTLLSGAERDYASLMKRCAAFDEQLMTDLTRSGGAKYAQMAALAYRQGMAGCGYAADANGMLLVLPKENSSNGCIATTDIFFPAAPQFLLLSSALAKGVVAPTMVYSTSPKWKFAFAPHDLGVYPQATGQVYAGGETATREGDLMPVEESGNMLILMLAIAKMEGNADFASKWWPILTKWEAYLEKYGKDPEDQLSTDDFMGHLAHNANLSVKAILAIGAYGELCRMRGETERADKYRALAREYAANWMQVVGDGDHSRLAFDKPNSWSQKYNLVWDKLLGLNVFPPSVAKQEVAFYKKQMQPYGLPLDSRTKLSKSDWTLWCATMADNQADFETLTTPLYNYLHTTGARLPFVDSYYTDNVNSDGMRARPVIGGVFIKMLDDPAMWSQYAQRGAKASNNFAPFPKLPVVTTVVPTSQNQPQTWRVTEQNPGDGWMNPGYNDANWNLAPAPFGTGGGIGTVWRSNDIWIRRDIKLPQTLPANIKIAAFHDEDLRVYINGVLAMKAEGYTGAYDLFDISPEARAQMKPGATITVAATCHQNNGGQFLDIGFSSETMPLQ